MDRGKEKIIEYAVIAGIAVALFAAIVAFNNTHAQLRISDGLPALEDIRTLVGLDKGPKPAPASSNDPCIASGACRVYFPGGVRG